MSRTVTHQIYELLLGLWSQIDHVSLDSELRESFNSYARKNPEIFEALKASQPSRDKVDSIYSPSTENDLFHLFRDPFAQVVTAMTGRINAIDQKKPMTLLSNTLAMALFYLENTQTDPYRKLFRIGDNDNSRFAQFLNEIDVTALKIKELIPAALKEANQDVESFKTYYNSLALNNPPRVLKLIESTNTAIYSPAL